MIKDSCPLVPAVCTCEALAAHCHKDAPSDEDSSLPHQWILLILVPLLGSVCNQQV